MIRFSSLTAIILSFALLLTSSIVIAQGDKGMEMSQQHRGKVSNVVQELTEIAGKDQNIGEEVRQIAMEEQESSERAAQAMEAVETRGGFKTFLIGTDYKNIGVLRSELVTTQNHIDRLTRAQDRAASDEVKADLDVQIAALQETKTSAENFIRENESKFSLLGWLVRLFR